MSGAPLPPRIGGEGMAAQKDKVSVGMTALGAASGMFFYLLCRAPAGDADEQLRTKNAIAQALLALVDVYAVDDTGLVLLDAEALRGATSAEGGYALVYADERSPVKPLAVRNDQLRHLVADPRPLRQQLAQHLSGES